MKNIYRLNPSRTFVRLFNPGYQKYLEKEIIGTCESLLDVGCGANSPVKYLSRKLSYTVGIDHFQPNVEKSREAGIHTEYKVMDALDIGKTFKENSFDCVMAIDLIEHLAKRDGLKLLSLMEKIARKKVIVFTPNGFLPQDELDNNPFEKHVSGWDVDEMGNLGFRVTGVHGWKPLTRLLRTIESSMVGLWLLRISMLSQIVVAKRPRHAFQLFCVKEK